MYIYARSDQQINLYPSNKNHTFTVQLAHEVYLEGAWEVGLISFVTEDSTQKEYIILCNICDTDFYVNDIKLGALRSFLHRKNVTSFSVPIYVTIVPRHFRQLTFTVLNAKTLELANLHNQSVSLLIHLRRC